MDKFEVKHMAMTKHNAGNKNQIFFTSLDELVPQDDLVRKLEACIDWDFIYPMVEHLYSNVGRPSIDPVVLFKMVFINIIFGINSMRRTCKEIKVNMSYRWFVGIGIDQEVPNYSTWSQNYIRRFGDSDVFDQIFTRILEEVMDYGYLDLTTIFGDSTHQKANANKNKFKNENVELAKKIYEDELLKEINEDRETHGKKPLKAVKRTEVVFDEKTGEEKVEKETKNIKVSTTDPESGCFHKGEKQKCFAYSHQTFCDRHGFVVEVETVPGNVHDSTSFFRPYEKMLRKYGDDIQNMALDTGYNVPAICKRISDDGKKMFAPYQRARGQKGQIKKKEFEYDKEYDYYICPVGQILKYSTTDREGYRQYKSNPKECATCPLREQCTKSNNMTKVITRHIWQEYKDEVNERRLTEEFKDIYPKRKESIERVFADCKEQHNLRFTRVKGLKRNQHQVLMIFACHNLKKMANWSWDINQSMAKAKSNLLKFYIKIQNLTKMKIKRKWYSYLNTTLSTI